MEVLNYMRLFVEVAKVKSFRRAAEILDMPNSTLSRNIGELEKVIGLRLFNRSTRKVELTEAGEAYFMRCQSIVEEARIAHEALLEIAERPTGTLRVSMPVDLATNYLAPIIAEFSKKYPLISFEFDLTPRTVDLQTEPFDLAIRIGPPPATPSTLVAREVAVLPRYLFAAPSYLKNAPVLNHPTDLHNHVVCVAQGTKSNAGLLKKIRRGDETVDVQFEPRFVMNSVGLCRSLGRIGIGIAVLDAGIAREDVASGQLRRVLPEWQLAPVQVHAITESRLLPARTRLFIEALKAGLQEYSMAR